MAESQNETENLVSLDDICQHLGVDSVTVYTWISTKKMPSHLVDGAWMFDVTQVDEWKQETVLEEPDAGSPETD